MPRHTSFFLLKRISYRMDLLSGTVSECPKDADEDVAGQEETVAWIADGSCTHCEDVRRVG